MTNKELQELLKQWPDDIEVKLLTKNDIPVRSIEKAPIIPFTEENILESSEEAWVDDEADPETWDCEDGKIMQKGKRYLLLNPIIT